MNDKQQSRRRYLTALAGVSSIALTGCIGGDDDGEGSDSVDDGENDRDELDDDPDIEVDEESPGILQVVDVTRPTEPLTVGSEATFEIQMANSGGESLVAVEGDVTLTNNTDEEVPDTTFSIDIDELESGETMVEEFTHELWYSGTYVLEPDVGVFEVDVIPADRAIEVEKKQYDEGDTITLANELEVSVADMRQTNRLFQPEEESWVAPWDDYTGYDISDSLGIYTVLWFDVSNPTVDELSVPDGLFQPNEGEIESNDDLLIDGENTPETEWYDNISVNPGDTEQGWMILDHAVQSADSLELEAFFGGTTEEPEAALPLNSDPEQPDFNVTSIDEPSSFSDTIDVTVENTGDATGKFKLDIGWESLVFS